MEFPRVKTELEENGFAVLDPIYSSEEISNILECIGGADKSSQGFLKSEHLFAIRQLLQNVPSLSELLFTKAFVNLLKGFSKSSYFLTKALYFDKPNDSNWFVGYHQDLSIAVDKRVEIGGYSNWTFKRNQIGVQPPLYILEDTLTVRIHLDKTTSKNGALKVIPKSHLNGVVRTPLIEKLLDNGAVCEVEKGGVMLMKPLFLHASNRATNGLQRRVIHLEFNKHNLPEGLDWLEKLAVPY